MMSLRTQLNFLIQNQIVLAVGCGVSIFFNAVVYKLDLSGVIPVVILGMSGTHLVYSIPPIFFDTNYNRWSKIRNANIGLLIADILAICWALQCLTMNASFFAGGLGIVCLLYFFGIEGRYVQFRSLRSIPFLKSLIIPLIWSFIVVYLPLANASVNFLAFHLVELLRYFFFFFAIATIFDLSDKNFDTCNSLISIPTYFGNTITRILSIISSSAYLALTYIQFAQGEVLFAAIISSVLISYSAVATSPKQLKIYLSNWLDSILIIQPFIYFIAKSDLFSRLF